MTWQLGSEWPARAGKTIKGMFVALALVLTLSREPDPLSTLLALAGAVLAFTLGEVYDAAIEDQMRTAAGCGPPSSVPSPWNSRSSASGPCPRW